MRRRLGLFLVPLLGALAVLASLALREAGTPHPATPGPRADAAPRDWYAEGLEVEAHDERGRLRYRLQAARAEGRADGRSRLEAPRLELHTRRGDVWRVRAGRARAAEGRVVLERAVRARRVAGGRPLAIDTERLVAYPERDYAETDLPVRLAAPRMETEAVGLRAWLARERLELLSRVRSRYGPQG